MHGVSSGHSQLPLVLHNLEVGEEGIGVEDEPSSLDSLDEDGSDFEEEPFIDPYLRDMSSLLLVYFLCLCFFWNYQGAGSSAFIRSFRLLMNCQA